MTPFSKRSIFPATVVVFLAVLWVKAIYPSASGIADTDFFWHLTYGQWMIEHSAIPSVDSFSWTFSGAPYQLTQWLGEVAIGAAYNAWGLEGTKAMSVTLAAVIIGLNWAAAKRFVDSTMALGLAITCNLVQIVTPMRPQLFSFAMLALVVYLAVSWLETGRQRYLVLVVPVMVLWVNLHGGFVVGLMLLGLLALGRTAEVWKEKKLFAERSSLGFLWGIVVAATLATCLNPYGYKALTAVLMIGGLQSSNVISEWMPVNITSELGWFYLLNLIPFMAIIIISGVKPRISYALIAGFFLVFGFLANRQVALCAAVMAPLTASVLGRTEHYARMLPTIRNPDHPIFFGFLSLCMLISMPLIVTMGNTALANSLNTQYPIKATDFLVESGLTTRVLSDTLESSYLIHRRVPVFVDGRMDLYRDRFFFEWYLASRAAPGWNGFIEKHAPEAMLLRVDMAIRQAALAEGKWKQVYQDARYSILVPTQSALPEVPIVPVEYLSPEGKIIGKYMP